ncbi:MAG TPA: hypothetical protein VGD12_03670 [Blastococcus sp.]
MTDRVNARRRLTTRRLVRARRLLGSTDTSVDRIAATAGSGTPASVRAQLRTALEVAPLRYRRTCRGPAAHSM